MHAPTLARRYIDALIDGGVPDTEQRTVLVADLLLLNDENPEVDPEAVAETLLRAARAIFADGLALADTDLPIKLEIDKAIRELDDARDRAVNMTPQQQQNEGLQSDEWYCGAMEGLQLLRRSLLGSALPTRRNA